MQDHKALRPIVPLTLGNFRPPEIPDNYCVIWRAAWYLVNALFFQSSILALIPNTAKAWLLRKFGAQVGYGFVCKPKVTIKYPWFLSVGNNVWIGEQVWIDNLCDVTIGDDVCLSQGAKILTGSHDWKRPDFAFFSRPVTIGNGVWVTAFRVLRPGVDIPANVAVVSNLSPSALKKP